MSIKEQVLKEFYEAEMQFLTKSTLKDWLIDRTIRKTKEQILKEIKEKENPYPKDIFRWNNKEKLNFNRGRFNRHCFEIVENTKADIIKQLKKKQGGRK